MTAVAPSYLFWVEPHRPHGSLASVVYALHFECISESSLIVDSPLCAGVGMPNSLTARMVPGFPLLTG
jgi:hypothetical protein